MMTAMIETKAYDALNCVVIQLDPHANIWFMNRHVLQLLGYERLGQLFGKPLREVLAPDEIGNAELMSRIAGHQNLPKTVDTGFLRSDGLVTFLSLSISFLDADKQAVAPTILIGAQTDSLRHSQAEAEIFHKVSDNYSGSIVITAPDKTILYVNPAMLAMSGYTAGEVIGKTPAMFRSGKTPEEVYQNLRDTINAGGIWNGEFTNRRKNGELFLESKTISSIRDAAGRVQYYFGIGEDVSRRQHYIQRIESLLAFDQLTGLPNRAAFLQTLADALESARRDQKEVTVLHIDVDDFFVVNDAVGADEADRIIAEIATSITTVLRQSDQVARLGNDKFAILIGPHEPDIDTDIRDLVERVLETIRRPIERGENTVQVTASVGLSNFPADGESADDLLTHAINATERAKSEGGDCCHRFDATNAQHVSGQRERLVDLRQAIGRDELVLHFQPQVSLFSGRIIGLEALIRWQHPSRGLIFPGEFIPLAEKNALIVDVGAWVLHETCRQMRRWLDKGLPSIKVAINLAARHFLVPGLHREIADALAGTRIVPHNLEIEITEGAMMQDISAAIRSTAQLKEVGVRLSLDDFGTGYSSLAYLSRFPIDVVKIDQSFVQDITSNPVNAAIAQATIAMSHKLGKIVLAEGVETEEQMQYLRRNECDEMQGYFFSKPLPADSVGELLRAGAVMPLAAGGSTHRRSTVLFVDDEGNILSSLKRTLRREGYDILTADSASQGFSLLATNDVQVIVSDQRMPEMNGTEFLSRVKNLYPETVRMVLSGYSEISAVTDAINKGAVYRFMMKPWDDEVLKEEIAGALRHWRETYGARE